MLPIRSRTAGVTGVTDDAQRPSGGGDSRSGCCSRRSRSTAGVPEATPKPSGPTGSGDAPTTHPGEGEGDGDGTGPRTGTAQRRSRPGPASSGG